MRRDTRCLISRRLGLAAVALTLVAFLDPALCGALPSAYFPNNEPIPTTETAWADLAERFPLRVKPAARVTAETPVFPKPQPVQINPGVVYVRLHQVGGDLSVVSEVLATPTVILDFRFLRGALEESLALGRALARAPLAIERTDSATPAVYPIEPTATGSSRHIVIGLVNRETCGPLEAVLDALQARGDLLLVGERTAGDVGKFETAPAHPAWMIITGDYRRRGGPSLLESGVVPQLAITVAPDADLAAYRAFDAGVALATLLDTPVEKARFDEARLLQQHGESNGRTTTTTARPAPLRGVGPSGPEAAAGTRPAGEAARNQTTEKPAPSDRVLQRAVNTLIALRALRRAPDS